MRNTISKNDFVRTTSKKNCIVSANTPCRESLLAPDSDHHRKSIWFPDQFRFAQDFLDGCFLLNELPEGIVALGAYIKSLFIMAKGVVIAGQHKEQSHTHVSVF